MKLSDLFELRGKLDKKTSTLIALIGFLSFVLLWQSMSWFKIVPESLLPPPLKVLLSFKELHFKYELVRNTIYSLKLNLFGYTEAIAISLPIGILMGLIPVVRAATDRYIKALRFLPLAATTGIFISWFHLTDNMKIQFLAVSIIVYLVPIIIQRVDDVLDVYVHTAYTLGASKIQILFTVFLPAIKSVIVDDIRILVAISWTYITIAETVYMSQGIGMLASQCGRANRVEMVFAILVLIMVIGFFQDLLFKKVDSVVNPHKYS